MCLITCSCVCSWATKGVTFSLLPDVTTYVLSIAAALQVVRPAVLLYFQTFEPSTAAFWRFSTRFVLIAVISSYLAIARFLFVVTSNSFAKNLRNHQLLPFLASFFVLFALIAVEAAVVTTPTNTFSDVIVCVLAVSLVCACVSLAIGKRKLSKYINDSAFIQHNNNAPAAASIKVYRKLLLRLRLTWLSCVCAVFVAVALIARQFLFDTINNQPTPTAHICLQIGEVCLLVVLLYLCCVHACVRF